MPAAKTIISPAMTAFALSRANGLGGGQFNRDLSGSSEQEVIFINLEITRLKDKRDFLVKKRLETNDKDLTDSLTKEIESLESNILQLQNKVESINISNYALYYSLLSTLSCGASAYHGYKRNESIGWAIVWGFLGGAFPVIVPAIGIAQGFGKKKVAK